MAATVGKAFEKFFYEFSLHESYFKNLVPSRGKYVGLRHVAYVYGGISLLINYHFPFNPPFPTMGMAPAGYEGTWVMEKDHHKALAMYDEMKTGKKTEGH